MFGVCLFCLVLMGSLVFGVKDSAGKVTCSYFLYFSLLLFTCLVISS